MNRVHKTDQTLRHKLSTANNKCAANNMTPLVDEDSEVKQQA